MIESFRLLINAFMFKIENSIKDSVANWNQNEKTAVNYIKNRPFYEETNEHGETIIHQIDAKFIPTASDEEVLAMIAEVDVLPAVTDADGSILTDENGNILIW